MAEQYRHICPYNCYSACGIISRVTAGRVIGLSGDLQHGYNRGHLCAKGHSFLSAASHPDRLRSPMLQQPRGSGRFKEIDWPEALSILTTQMVSLYNQYGSYEPVCLYTQSGNMGTLHQAWSWLAHDLGCTIASGSLCWGAGLDALGYDVGRYTQPRPESMRQSKYIICWGANPAWTAIHQMEYIHQARDMGAKLIVIDPVYTATAAQADRYIQLRPGTDGALALVIAHYLCQANLIDQDYIDSHVEGWQEFHHYLTELDIEALLETTGVDYAVVQELAEELAAHRPAAFWLGFGLQRHTNGGQNIRTISALAAITGTIACDGGGIFYANTANLDFLNSKCEAIAGCANAVRTIPAYDLANALDTITGNPIKLLLLASANPLVQNAEIDRLTASLTKLDFIVVADQYLTATARQADLVLPVTNFLEHVDVVASYWHNWIGINQQAVAPLGHCRSDLAIVTAIACSLQAALPGTSQFPVLSEEEWLDRLFDSELCERLAITSYHDLLTGPREVSAPDNPWKDNAFGTPSGRYELLSSAAQEQGLPELPVYHKPQTGTSAYPYRLITPHVRDSLNSQFAQPSGADSITAHIHPALAARLGLQQGSKGRLYNGQGELSVRIACTLTVPEDTVVIYQQPYSGRPLNSLASPLPTDMGRLRGSGQSVAYYDTFVNISC